MLPIVPPWRPNVMRLISSCLIVILAVPAAVQDRRLPDYATFMAEVRKRLEADDVRQSEYVYVEARREQKPLQNASQPGSVEDNHVIEKLAPDRSDKRSTYGFCHGACGAVSTLVMPIASAVAPRPANERSRSWSKYRCAASHGNASRTRWTVHAAVGCAVTATCTTCSRS